jgi:general secretion pathway protein J
LQTPDSRLPTPDSQNPTASRTSRRCPTSRHSTGFTLLELIVAVAVFALVAVMAQAGLRQVIADADALRAASERQRELQLLLLKLERELGQVLARPVRSAYGEERAALLGRGNSLEYSTLAFVDGARLAPQRHALSLRGRELLLTRQTRLDAGPGTPRIVQVLSNEVEVLSFNYLAADGERYTRWPPPRQAGDSANLPRAIVLRLRLTDLGEIERLIELPENPS